MTDLQCPARFLVCVVDHRTAISLRNERVAAVYDGTSGQAGQAVAAQLGVPVAGTTYRVAVEAVLEREPAVLGVLAELADLHRGETVLVAADGGSGQQVEVSVDGDGVRVRQVDRISSPPAAR